MRNPVCRHCGPKSGLRRFAMASLREQRESFTVFSASLGARRRRAKMDDIVHFQRRVRRVPGLKIRCVACGFALSWRCTAEGGE